MKKAWFLLLLLGAGCATIQPKQVSLSNERGELFSGTLVYTDPFSGAITVDKGPGGEAFSGMFVVVDRTAVSSGGGMVIAPSVNGQQPVVGGAQSASYGNVEAGGFWHAIGSRGGFMDCELLMGRQGHGKGTCKHSNGKLFGMLL